MTDPESLAAERCEVLLRLAAEQDVSGDGRQARQLYASALCEARRSGRLDLIDRVHHQPPPCRRIPRPAAR